MAINPKVLLLDELSMGLAPLIVEELYEVVKRIAAEDVSILIVEQFAHEVLGVADVAAIMLHGSIQLVGKPTDVAEALQAAYLGGAVEKLDDRVRDIRAHRCRRGGGPSRWRRGCRRRRAASCR